MDRLIKIGKINRNQGNRGEVRVLPLTDIRERFLQLEGACLARGDDPPVFREIEDVWFHKQFVIIKFSGIDDIGQALELKDYFVMVPEAKLPVLPEGEFYVHNLLECQVYTESGRYLGRVIQVLDTGGADILVIEDEDQQYMVPFARQFISELRPGDKQLVIKPIPGLLDL
ncbi:MAG: ribosome maturation factor RimM [Bacillota bacterium]